MGFMSLLFSSAAPDEIQKLEEAIASYNLNAAIELPTATMQKWDLVARNQSQELIGGVQAKVVSWGILYIELLYVFEPFRRQGMGSKILKEIEKSAREKGCHLSHLMTLDFQAKDFYLKQGYTIFGTLENYPKGHRRYYLKKDL